MAIDSAVGVMDPPAPPCSDHDATPAYRCRIAAFLHEMHGRDNRDSRPDMELDEGTSRPAHRDGLVAWNSAEIRRVKGLVHVEPPVAAHQERANTAPCRTELYEPRGDSRLLRGARDPVQDRRRVPAREGEDHEGHRSQADRPGPCPPLPHHRPGRSADP